MIRPRELSRDLALFPAKTPTLPPATHTNSYALGTEEILLVEPATPYEDEQRAWIQWARSLVSQGRKAKALVLTHHHEDHVGGVDVIARELGLPVWAHEETAKRVGPEKVQKHLVDGETITLEGDEQWLVHHTPGHAPGHICLQNTCSRTLIVGDMVASVGTILIAPGDGDMKIYLEQLERLARLDASLALPAHGEPIDEPTALFRRYVQHRLMRENKALQAVVASPGNTDAELLPIAYDDTPAHLYPIALLSLRAHLDKLAQDGRVVSKDGRWRAT
ncbi:MAG TPA: MBL fold metallo-hydrolase [Polyangiaceae bacterium]